MKRRVTRLPLLLVLLLVACGKPDPVVEPTVEAAPEPVDPASLEVDATAADAAAPVAEVPEWLAPQQATPREQWKEALAAATTALEEGRLLRTGDDLPGAVEILLGILLADAAHADASHGLSLALDALHERARRSLLAGRLGEGGRAINVLRQLQPDRVGLADLDQLAAQAALAADHVHKAATHTDAGRVLKPAERNAVDQLHRALKALPEFQPALDALARLEADRINRALAAAQLQDYEGADRMLDEARRIRPESSAAQDMGARIVELRQARTETLLAQGQAAVEALDLELAERRLDEARQVSLQGQGLEALAARIELARHYGRHAPGQVFHDALAGGGQGPEMVVIPHGSFRMGSPAGEPHRLDEEGPVFEVSFARGFALARNETSVGEFARFVEATGYRSVASRRGASTVYDERGGAMAEHRGVDWRRDYAGREAKMDMPVIHVAFEDAEAYAAWLSAQTGARYSLPSEAEFEYALRAGSETAFPWGIGPPPAVVGNLTGDGDRSLRGRSWSNAIRDYDDGHWGPAPVRSFPREGFGTFDLIGNVSEWVQDCWHDSYRRAPEDGSPWVNAGCPERVIRGASWASSLDRVRSAYRQPAAAATTHARLGFRVRREL
ncbi:MAG TPA: SUMF1/EgtB/PvdO family nonheme iron enzyme [Arenimonas sp.]|nr:SUMF1/EgtB/PvdO family nonheme iron enzyme [Arenimonas sp.]